MPIDSQQRSSLAFRKNRDLIESGQVPEKYTRILPHVRGKRILEIGAAEGVLSLLMAERGAEVISLELREGRHADAITLQRTWLELGRDVANCTFVCGDIRQQLDLLTGVDTLVAVRCIYYLRQDVMRVFAEVAKHCRHVVLCGNGNRARRFFERNGYPGDELDRFNFYASRAGMAEVLVQNGYRIVAEVAEGDPIVVGERHEGGRDGLD